MKTASMTAFKLDNLNAELEVSTVISTFAREAGFLPWGCGTLVTSA